MIKSGFTPRRATIGAKIQSFVRLKWFLSLAIAVLFTVAATPPPTQENPDEQYIAIITMIDKADALNAAGKVDAAKAKYKDCEKALLYFKATNPLFAPRTVAYRLKEVTEKADTRPKIVEPTPSEKSKANLEAPAAAAPSKSGVKLIEPGAEPRTVLRYHPKAGDKQLAIMNFKIKMDMPMPQAAPGGAAPQVPAIPAITIPMDMTVQSVAANGDITFESVMGDAGFKEEPGMQPEMVQAMKTALAGLKGLTSVGVMSSRGISKKMDIKPTANTDPQAKQMMEQIKEGTGNLNVPFPDEAVGVGAKWELKKVTKVQMASIEQAGTYELNTLEGDKLTTKYTVDFSSTAPAGQQAAAAGQTSGHATGSASLDLSKLVGASATMDMHMEIPVGKGQTGKMDMNLSIEAQ